MILMVNVLMKEISEFGMDLMLALTLIYLILVWKWKPYNEAVNFHNKALRLNHLGGFVFVLTCEFLNRVEMSGLVFVGMIYLSLVLLLVISLCGYARLYVEYQFRKKLKDDPSLMESKKKELKIEMDVGGVKLSKKQKLLANNKYTLESQIKESQMKESLKEDNMLSGWYQAMEDDNLE